PRAAIAAINSWQLIPRPLSPSTTAAASKALSFFAAAASTAGVGQPDGTGIPLRQSLWLGRFPPSWLVRRSLRHVTRQCRRCGNGRQAKRFLNQVWAVVISQISHAESDPLLTEENHRRVLAALLPAVRLQLLQGLPVRFLQILDRRRARQNIPD